MNIYYTVRRPVVALALMWAWFGAQAEAQLLGGAAPGTGVRRVQASAGEMPTPPAPSPEPGPTTPGEGDAEAPAAANPLAGGEPTQAAQEAEAAEEPEPDETKLLMNALGMEDSPIKIYGWIQNSYTGNTNGKPPSGENFGVFPNHRANSWLGNQYYLIVEKALEQNDELNFGFRADNLFGHDWQFNKMYGFADEAFNLNQFAGYDLAQIYAEAHVPLGERSLDVKFGRWYTLHGYEVVPATGRPLLSVPYMFVYGQPFTHVGVLTTYHASDKLTIYNGTTNGWDRWFNENYNWGYIGGFNRLFGEDDKGSFTGIVSTGPNQFPTNLPANTTILPTGIGPGNVRSGADPNIGVGRNPGYDSNLRTQVTGVLTYKWTDKLTHVMEGDYSFEENIPGLAGDGGLNQNAEWYGFGNWFLYNFTDQLTGVWRSEVFRDDDGIRTGTPDTFYEVTLGAIYKPQPWLWFRPEARYDWAQFKSPYNDGTRSSQFTIAFDVTLLY